MQAGKKLQLRLPQDMKEWLKEDAARNSRSMNGQVLAALRELMKAQAPETQIDQRIGAQ